MYRDEGDSIKLSNVSTASGCTSVKTHHSNIALLSVAPSKRVLKSTAALVAQPELGYKNKFPSQLPPKPQPSQAAKFRKRLQLTEGVTAFPLR